MNEVDDFLLQLQATLREMGSAERVAAGEEQPPGVGDPDQRDNPASSPGKR